MRIVPQREPHEKMNLVRDITERVSWRALHEERCMICGTRRDHADFRGLQVHHIAGAAGRSDEPCNFLLVCGVCHEAIHAGKLELDDILAAKQLCDPENFDRDRVMVLRGRRPNG